MVLLDSNNIQNVKHSGYHTFVSKWGFNWKLFYESFLSLLNPKPKFEAYHYQDYAKVKRDQEDLWRGWAFHTFFPIEKTWIAKQEKEKKINHKDLSLKNIYFIGISLKQNNQTFL